MFKVGHFNNIGITWRKPKNGGKFAHQGRGDDPCKIGIHLGQHELADIILKHLRGLPSVKVHFETSLKCFEVLEGCGVRSYFSGPNQTLVEHISRFLIGADEGRSTVRKLLDIPLECSTWGDFSILAANIIYDLETESDWGPANLLSTRGIGRW